MFFCGYRRVCIFAVLLMMGCGSDELSKDALRKMSGGKLKDVVPVSGVVRIDGSPEAGINIYLHAKDKPNPLQQCRTDSDGKYCWTTYTLCDGLAPGDYKLSFQHIPKESRKGGGEDLFKGRYSDSMKSEYSLTVAQGEPQKDVDFDLKSK